MKVEHMVCPLCSRMNGQHHHDGCPNGSAFGTMSIDYTEGWIAASNALMPPASRARVPSPGADTA